MEYLLHILEQLTGNTVAFQITFTLTIALAIFTLAIGILYIVSSFYSPLRKRLQTWPRTRRKPAQRNPSRGSAHCRKCMQSESFTDPPLT